MAPILDEMHRDKDLDLQIRGGYINIYFKGNSLLKLTEKGPELYAVDIHEKFLGGIELGPFADDSSEQGFVGRYNYHKSSRLFLLFGCSENDS